MDGGGKEAVAMEDAVDDTSRSGAFGRVISVVVAVKSDAVVVVSELTMAAATIVDMHHAITQRWEMVDKGCIPEGEGCVFLFFATKEGQ